MPLAVLSIDLEAKLAKLQEGMDKAARLGEKTAGRIDSAFSGLKVAAAGLAGVLAGAFAGVSVTGFITDTAAAIDALNDVADATGSTVENLSALEDVARRNGATLDDVSGILVKFNQGLKEADGKNGISQALKAIGLDAAELKKLDPSEALRQTAVALSRYADDGDKARLTQELFGKSVKEAAPFLKDLAEQGRLNATITSEQAAEAERFNKQLFALKTNASNFGRTIVSDLIPALNQWLESYQKIGGLSGSIASRLGLDEQGKLESRAREVSAEIQRVGDSISRMSEQLSRDPSDARLALRIDKARERLRALSNEASAVSEALKGTANNLAPLGSEDREFSLRDKAKKSVGPLPSAPGKAAKPSKPETFGPEIPQATLDAIKALERTDTTRIAALNAELQELLSMPNSPQVEEAIRSVSDSLGKLDPAQQAAIKQQEKLNALLDATPSAQLDATRTDMLLLTKAFEDGAISVQQYEEAVQARLGTLPEALGKKLDEMNAFADQAKRNIQDALGDTLSDVFKGDFDNILDKWGDLLADMAAQAAAARLNTYLFGDGKDNKGVIGPAFDAIVGALFGGGKAQGGPVEAGRLYRINETGVPEVGTFGGRDYLLTGANSGRITPLKQAGGGAAPVFHITQQIGSSITRNDVQALIHQANAALEGKILQSMRNGGVYARAAR